MNGHALAARGSPVGSRWRGFQPSQQVRSRQTLTRSISAHYRPIFRIAIFLSRPPNSVNGAGTTRWGHGQIYCGRECSRAQLFFHLCCFSRLSPTVYFSVLVCSGLFTHSALALLPLITTSHRSFLCKQCTVLMGLTDVQCRACLKSKGYLLTPRLAPCPACPVLVPRRHYLCDGDQTRLADSANKSKVTLNYNPLLSTFERLSQA